MAPENGPLAKPSARTKRSDADRRLRQADRFARILRVLQLIQGRGRWNAPAIAAENECSVRTVRRDLDVLELAGVPYYVDRLGGGYRVRPDYRFPVANLTEEEALGQAVATVTANAPGLTIGPGARPTTRKLQVTAAETTKDILADAERLIAVFDLKLADHSRHREIIRTVQWALIGRKQVSGRYHSPYEGKAVSLRLHPYRLCLVKNAWYLVARPHDADEPRTYRILRFKSLRALDEPAEVRAGFDLRKYFGHAWAVYRGDRTYDVALRFTKDATDVVCETTWHPTQKVRRAKDGTITMTFTVDGLNEIVRWVLGWAGRVTVLRPDELRELVIDHHKKALRANEAGRD